MICIGLYRENVKKIFLSETTRSKALIFGMEQHLVDLYQVCSDYSHGAKYGQPRGSHVLHGLIVDLYQVCSDYSHGAKYGQPRGSHVLHGLIVDLYQVCSNYTPVARDGPALGPNVLHRLYRET